MTVETGLLEHQRKGKLYRVDVYQSALLCDDSFVGLLCRKLRLPYRFPKIFAEKVGSGASFSLNKFEARERLANAVNDFSGNKPGYFGRVVDDRTLTR